MRSLRQKATPVSELRAAFGGRLISPGDAYDEARARREAYPGPTWGQLARTKLRYDPANLFWLNQNIPLASVDPTSRRKEGANSERTA